MKIHNYKVNGQKNQVDQGVIFYIDSLTVSRSRLKTVLFNQAFTEH